MKSFKAIFVWVFIPAIFFILFIHSNGYSQEDKVSKASVNNGQNSTSAGAVTPDFSSGGPDLFTGAFSHNIPIQVPTGRNGMQPGLALIYQSNSGNGWLGVGWQLEAGAIERSTKYGVNYNSEDYVHRTNGATSELVYTGGSGNNEYSAKIEGAFNRYKKLPSADGNYYWEITDKNGTRYLFGQTSASRQDDPADTSRVFKWCLDRVEDTNGNYMVLVYYKDQGQIYLDQIDYTGHASGLAPSNYVKFNRESRTDAPVMYTSNFGIKTAYRLKTIDVVSNGSYPGGSKVRTYNLSYLYGNSTSRSNLTNVQLIGKDGITIMPIITAAYSAGSKFFSTVISAIPANYSGDFDGDGKTDLLTYYIDGNIYIALSTGSSFTTSTLWATCSSGDIPLYPGDFDGDGKTDFLRFETGGVRVYLSTGTAFSNSIWSNADTSTYHFGDFNGDGKTDMLRLESGGVRVYLSTGTSFSDSMWSNTPDNANKVYFGDFNGDGKIDMLRLESGGVRVFISTGTSFTDSIWNGTVVSTTKIYTGDFNGDGKTDFMAVDNAGNVEVFLSTGTGFANSLWGAVPTGDVTLYLGDFNGDGKMDFARSDGTGTTVNISTGYNFINSSWSGASGPFTITGDFTGDSRSDLLYLGSASTSVFISNADSEPLVKISNGIGGVTDIYYNYLSGAQLRFPVRVVSSIVANDGNGVISRTTYSFNGGFYHVGERDFRGFNRIIVTGPLAGSGGYADQTITETWFHQGNDTTVGVNNPNVPIGFMKGKPYRIKVTGRNNRTYTEATISYQAAGSGPSYFNPPRQVDTTIDGVKQTKTIYAYDSYGNVTREDRNGDISEPNDDSTIMKEYGYNTDAWIVGLPKSESVYQGIGAGLKVASTDFYYDGVTDCNTASTNQIPIKGKLTRAVRWSSTGSSPELKMAYDDYGNMKCSADPNNNITSVVYDASNTFPKIVINPLGHQTVTEYYGIDGTTDDKGLYGQVKSAKDPNLAVTLYEYDSLGRNKKIIMPDNTWTAWSYNSFGVVNSQNIQTDTSAGLSSWTYFDGLGRAILQKKTGPDNKYILQKTVYDERGYVHKSSLPYFTNSPPRLDNELFIYDYDTLGRIVKKKVPGPESSYITMCYSGWVTASIDANEHKKRYTYDAYGRLVRVDEYQGEFRDCDTGAGTPYATTTYQYDTAGNLLKVTDALGNMTEMTYDSLGRKMTIKDPDMGTWQYTYDNAGNLTSQLDNVGQWIYFQYDALNRLVNKFYNNQNIPDITYTYDGNTSYGTGRLTGVTKYQNSETIYYDVMGRVVRNDKTVGGTYIIQNSYDSLGRLSAVTYPDNSTVSYTYNGPFLYQVKEGTTNYVTYSSYIPHDSYNALGQPASATYGNSVITTYEYSSREYWIARIKTIKGSTVYHDMSYSYERNGNVRSISDAFNGNQDFKYDELDRLTQARGRNIITYTYNAIGNMTSNSLIGSYAYNPSGTNSIRPHAVISAGGNTYTYDANGNMISGAGKTIIYDPENRPMSITANGTTTSFTYDGNGARVKKISGANTTVYIGGLYECTNGTCDKFIFANGNRIAKKTVGTGTIHYYHTDHLGSSSAITDSAGNRVENITYYPFGQTRTDTAPAITRHKYTGQELDAETGLYFYNARYYDPVLGRFISADSIVPNPNDPQALNRYSYTQNNPMKFIDPTGHGNEYPSFFDNLWMDQYLFNQYVLPQPPIVVPDLPFNPVSGDFMYDTSQSVVFINQGYSGNYESLTNFPTTYFGWSFDNSTPSIFTGTGLNSTTDVFGGSGGDSNITNLLNVVLNATNANIKLDLTFLPINITWDLKGFSSANFTVNGVFPPLSAGVGFEINFNAPLPNEKFISPYAGFGKNLSVGTNVILNSKDIATDPLTLTTKGLNVNMGISVGLPVGVVIPHTFKNGVQK